MAVHFNLLIIITYSSSLLLLLPLFIQFPFCYNYQNLKEFKGNDGITDLSTIKSATITFGISTTKGIAKRFGAVTVEVVGSGTSD